MLITQRLSEIDKEIELIYSLPISDLVCGVYETRMGALEEEKQVLQRLIHPFIDRVSGAGYLSLVSGDAMDLVLDNLVNEVNRN